MTQAKKVLEEMWADVERWPSAAEWPEDTSRVHLVRYADDPGYWSAAEDDPAAPLCIPFSHAGYIHPLPEFVVGQQVSGDDYARLPVGARAQYERASASIVKVAADRWVYRGEGVTDPSTCPRTLTHLPDATEPEGKDDLYVEPEPLTEPSVDNSEDLTEPEDADDVAPEPLKEGDWVQVWAQVTRRNDDSGEFEHLIRERDDSGLGSYHLWQVHPDAIVRPDEGQTPPWIKPARCTSLLMVDKTTNLRQCTRDGDDHDNHVAYGASWKDDEAYGRVVVSDGAS